MTFHPKPKPTKQPKQSPQQKAIWCDAHDCLKSTCRQLHAAVDVTEKIVADKYKSNRTFLEEKLDRKVSQYIIARDKKCVICESTQNLENGHLFTRAAHSVRWDITPDGNCHAQCHMCNIRHEVNPDVYQFWYIKKFGADAYSELKWRYDHTNKFSEDELASMLASIPNI